MRKVVVSGAASGIGAALRARLLAAGWEVIGVDLQNADVVADLATPEGRRIAIHESLARCGATLHGVVACAGLGPHVRPHGKIVEVNYFGAVALFQGLRPALAAAGGAAAVAVGSNAATIVPKIDGDLAAACLSNEEGRATDLAGAVHGPIVYAATKLALTRWVRRESVRDAWIGAKIRLNAVAPGAIQTPLLQGGLDHPELGDAIRGMPIPAGDRGEPEHVAAAIQFLLSDDAAYCCGSVLFVDGGTDAFVRSNIF